jgi:hypothetical protein
MIRSAGALHEAGSVRRGPSPDVPGPVRELDVDHAPKRRRRRRIEGLQARRVTA